MITYTCIYIYDVTCIELTISNYCINIELMLYKCKGD